MSENMNTDGTITKEDLTCYIFLFSKGGEDKI